MELKWIEDFLSLVETRSFSRSADLRHVTQPAFSRRIRALEGWLGAYLFDRTSNPPRLTPAGEVFRAEAVEIEARVRRLRSLIYGKPGANSQIVRLALSHTLSPAVFSPWLAEVERHLHESDIVIDIVDVPDDDLARADRDRCLVMSFDHPSCSANMDLSAYEAVTVGHQLIKPYVRAVRGRKPLFELPGRRNAPLPLLGYVPGSYMHQVTGLILRQVPAHLVERYQMDSIERLKSMAMEGHGIAFLPEHVVRQEIDERYLTVAGDERWQVRLDVRLYRRSDDCSAGVSRMWSRLKAPTRPVAGCGATNVVRKPIVMSDSVQ